MSSPFSGGCLCGYVRYECKAEPMAVINCHCRDCQKTSGSGYSPNVIVPLAEVTVVRGEPKYHTKQADSGNTIGRGFCPECGTPLFGISSGAPNLMGIRAASLDDPSWLKPMADIWVASAQPWDVMNPDLPKFPKYPPPPPT